jgi:hypothetical protein
MNRVLAVSFLLAGLCCLAVAQDRSSFEVFGGYSYVRATGALTSPISIFDGGDVRSSFFPHHGPTKGVNLNGWEASIAYRRDHLGFVVDTSGHYGSANTVDECDARFLPCVSPVLHAHFTIQNYILAGPRYYFGGEHFSPFVHALFGYTHWRASFDANPAEFFTPIREQGNGFGAALGVGADIKLAPHFGYRLFQADYFPTHLNRKTEHNLRASTGLVLKF